MTAPARRRYARPMSEEQGPPSHDIRPSKIGHFIQTYSSFLSSFVIGVAGLVATSIWQYRQSQTALKQAESEQKIAATKAENEWRIARAEILAKNLGVLSMQGANTADSRFGVLLSLTRGAILDPELAVSYALELGKDNANYMHDVLAATEHKNYEQLSQAYLPTCLERYGVERDADICRGDKLAERSHAIADLIHEEMDALDAAGDAKAAAQGPLLLLRNEREVESQVVKLAWLFEPYLQDLYEKRQWKEIAHFEAFSSGARLIAAVVLATARTGELMGESESADLERFHAEHRGWLGEFLLGKTCDPECRGRLLDLMLSVYGESDGDYDESIRRLLLLPRAESGPALAKLHGRLLWCQVDSDDQALFRDHVLVPTLAEALARPKFDPVLVEDLVGLLAMNDDPKDAAALQAWNALLASLQKVTGTQDHGLAKRRAAIKRERTSPPPMVKKSSFCGIAEATNPTSTE
jgi:hypothetical protein